MDASYGGTAGAAGPRVVVMVLPKGFAVCLL
jgi:hypothetical protein